MHRFTIAVTTLCAVLALGADAEDKPAAKGAGDETETARAAEALKLCLRGAKEYRLMLADSGQTELELKTDPVLRWSNPSVGSIHGVVFVWTDKGRPAAIASVFKWFDPLNSMAFEVHSLSEAPLVGNLGDRPVWKSSRPGSCRTSEAARAAGSGSRRRSPGRSIR